MSERVLTPAAGIQDSASSAQFTEEGKLPPPERRQRLVVVGFGMVAYRLIDRLAALEALGQYAVTVIGEEPYPAYNRVHLTGWLEHRELRQLALAPPGWSQALGVRVITGNPVTSIDRENQTVQKSSPR